MSFDVVFPIIKYNNSFYAAFTHVSLTISYRTKSLYKIIFVLSRSRDI